jgi:hypothetical protein
MFVGQFSLSDSQFQFANGTSTLLTDSTHWAAIYAGTNNTATVQSWVSTGATGTGIVSYGPNDGTGTYSASYATIDALAQFIWSDDPLANPFFPPGGNCYFFGCTVDFSTPIYSIATTPLPGALPLFATGLGALGLLGWRRKRKAAALAA